MQSRLDAARARQPALTSFPLRHDTGKMAAYIGLDLGTSGCRAVAIDDEGRTLAGHAVTLPPSQRRDDRAEQDPRDWWSATIACLQPIATQLADHSIAAIAVDGTSGSVLVCNPGGDPLSPGLMYDDARASQQAARVRHAAPVNTVAASATAGLPKLLWLGDHLDFPDPVYALNQADWIAGRLCGQFASSDYNNALRMGYDPLR
ncbi:MAG: FGGY family carbohydrate kinase, partial [Pseudomonadota bacterium]